MQLTFWLTVVCPVSLAEPPFALSSFTRKLLLLRSAGLISLSDEASGIVFSPRRPVTSVESEIPPLSRMSKDSRAAAFNWTRDRNTSAILIESYNMPKAAIISRLPSTDAIRSSIKVNPASLAFGVMAVHRQL